MFMYACICMYVYACMYMYVCMYVCICMCVCMYVCMYVYVCVHAYMCMYVCITYWGELSEEKMFYPKWEGNYPRGNAYANCPGGIVRGELSRGDLSYTRNIGINIFHPRKDVQVFAGRMFVLYCWGFPYNILSCYF